MILNKTNVSLDNNNNIPTPVNTSGDDDIGAGAFRFEGNPDCQSQ